MCMQEYEVSPFKRRPMKSRRGSKIFWCLVRAFSLVVALYPTYVDFMTFHHQSYRIIHITAIEGQSGILVQNYTLLTLIFEITS